MITRHLARVALVTTVVALCGGCSGNSPLEPSTAAGLGTTPVDFQGQYSGTYRVSNCVEDAIFVGFCEGSGLAAGATPPIALSLTQSRSTVTGSVALGQITGTFQGSASGTTLTGTAAMIDITNQGTTVSTAITAWSSTLAGNALSGGLTIVFKVPDAIGSATITATIVQLTR